jgi:penicillin amidase
MKTWQWGTLHTVTFSHPFGSRKPLDKVFNLGPYPIGGGGTTPNKSEYRFANPYGVAIGPSMRQVVDLANPAVAFTVITSGESGQPLQRHYDDQVPLWLNGGYLTMTIDWDAIEHGEYDRCELRP